MTGLTSFSGGMVMFSSGVSLGEGGSRRKSPNTKTRKSNNFVCKCHPIFRTSAAARNRVGKRRGPIIPKSSADLIAERPAFP